MKTKVLLIAMITFTNYNALGLERIKAYLDQFHELNVELKFHNMNNSFDFEKAAAFDYAYNNTIDYALDIFKEIKKISNTTYTFLGNHFATHCVDEIFKESSDVDFIVLGNGEIPLKNAIDCLNRTNDILTLDTHKNIVIKNVSTDEKCSYCVSLKEISGPVRINPYEKFLVYITTREGGVG